MSKITVNSSLLKRCRKPLTVGAAFEAAQLLGPLAPWWLGREARELMYPELSSLPAPPATIGSCVILMCARDYQLFGGAVGLPVRWRKGIEHSTMLPVGLREEANRVLEQLRPSNPWGLYLNSEAGLDQVDLSQCNDSFTWKSAWASLAGSLALAIYDIAPKPTAWASAAWDEHWGVMMVESIGAKLKYAMERSADVIAIPSDNRLEAVATIPDLSKPQSADLLVLLYASNRDHDPKVVLKEYLGRLSQEPSENAPFENKKNFYRTADRKRANEYHTRTLLPLAIQRNRYEAGKSVEFRPKVGITLASKQLSVVVQGLATANMAGNLEKAILLHDDRESDKPGEVGRVLEGASAFLKDWGIEAVERRPISLGSRASILKAARRLFHQLIHERNYRPSDIAIDLTPGFRLGPLAVYEAAPTGVWLMSCQHETMAPDQRVEPGSERYEIWSKARSEEVR